MTPLDRVKVERADGRDRSSRVASTSRRLDLERALSAQSRHSDFRGLSAEHP